MASENEVGCMFSCESSESSTGMHPDLAAGRDAVSGATTPTMSVGPEVSSSVPHGSGAVCGAMNAPTDSDDSVEKSLHDVKNWNFVEHFKRDPIGFLDEIVERYVHLSNVVILKNKLAKRAVEQSNIDRQQLLEEKKLMSDLRQELEDCKRSLEDAKADCRIMAVESKQFLQELDHTREQYYEARSEHLMKHNGICTIFRNAIKQTKSECADLAVDKANLLAEINMYKSQAAASASAGPAGAGGGGGEGGVPDNSQKYKRLCAALRNQLDQNQIVIQELQKRNEKLEFDATSTSSVVSPSPSPSPSPAPPSVTDEMIQNQSVENATLKDELKFYKKQFFDDNAEVLKKNNELQAELTQLQSHCQTLSAANEKLSTEMDIYRESFYAKESRGSQKLKAFCRQLQNEVLQQKETVGEFRLMNEKLTDKVADMKIMISRMDVHMEGLKVAIKMNAELEEQGLAQARAIELLKSLNAKLRAEHEKAQESCKELQKNLKRQLTQQKAFSPDGPNGPDGPDRDANDGKLPSLLMKMVHHVDKISTTVKTGHRPDSGTHSSSSNVSMSQVIGRDHLLMKPEEVLEDVFKAFCGLATDYWVTHMRPMQSMKHMPSAAGRRSSK